MPIIDYHTYRGRSWVQTRNCQHPVSHTSKRHGWPQTICFWVLALISRMRVALRGKAQMQGIALNSAGSCASKKQTVSTVPSWSVGVLGSHKSLMELHRMSRSRGGKRIDPVLTIRGSLVLQGRRTRVGHKDGAA